jgi:hypothetical protein
MCSRTSGCASESNHNGLMVERAHVVEDQDIREFHI